MAQEGLEIIGMLRRQKIYTESSKHAQKPHWLGCLPFGVEKPSAMVEVGVEEEEAPVEEAGKFPWVVNLLTTILPLSTHHSPVFHNW